MTGLIFANRAGASGFYPLLFLESMATGFAGPDKGFGAGLAHGVTFSSRKIWKSLDPCFSKRIAISFFRHAGDERVRNVRPTRRL
jgi:hypothetical protein